MKRIAYTVYGDNPKYLFGMQQNLTIVKGRYPDWNPVVIYDETSVPGEWVDRWRSANPSATIYDSSIVRTLYPKPLPRMFWRLLVHDLRGVSHMMVRDADSRPTRREMTAVQEWETSGKLFHTMRDHPAHQREINGGMWAARVPFCRSMASLIHDFLTVKGWDEAMVEYGLDQEFLCTRVWPLVCHSVLQHSDMPSPWGTAIPFPIPVEHGKFVGEVFDVKQNAHGQWVDIAREHDRQSRGFW